MSINHAGVSLAAPLGSVPTPEGAQVHPATVTPRDPEATSVVQAQCREDMMNFCGTVTADPQNSVAKNVFLCLKANLIKVAQAVV